VTPLMIASCGLVQRHSRPPIVTRRSSGRTAPPRIRTSVDLHAHERMDFAGQHLEIDAIKRRGRPETLANSLCAGRYVVHAQLLSLRNRITEPENRSMFAIGGGGGKCRGLATPAVRRILPARRCALAMPCGS